MSNSQSTPESWESVADTTAGIGSLNINAPVFVPNVNASVFVPSFLMDSDTVGKLI